MTATSPTDSVLATRVAGGEHALFEALMRRHNALVYRIARSVLRNDSDAEECAQQAWIIAFERISQFSAQGSFAGWIGRITHRRGLEMMRARSSRGELALGDGDDVMRDRHSDEPSTPEHEAERGNLRGLLETAIDGLPGVLREAFVLREVQGASFAEAGQILGLTEEHVRVRVHRAKARLRTSEELGSYASQVFGFDGARCDRICALVMTRILR